MSCHFSYTEICIYQNDLQESFHFAFLHCVAFGMCGDMKILASLVKPANYLVAIQFWLLAINKMCCSFLPPYAFPGIFLEFIFKDSLPLRFPGLHYSMKTSITFGRLSLSISATIIWALPDPLFLLYSLLHSRYSTFTTFVLLWLHSNTVLKQKSRPHLIGLQNKNRISIFIHLRIRSVLMSRQRHHDVDLLLLKASPSKYAIKTFEFYKSRRPVEWKR